MNLTGKIKAKIHHHTFNGVPDDVQVTVFIPGVKNPLKAMLTDIEIEEPPKALMTYLMSKPIYGQPGTIFAVNSGGFSPPGWFAEAILGGSVKGDDVVAALREAIPGLADARTACPACVSQNMKDVSFAFSQWKSPHCPLLDVIVHLNDHHKWSRERVADWLEEQDWDLQFKVPEAG